MYKNKTEKEQDYFFCYPYHKSNEYMIIQAYTQIIYGWILIVIGSCLFFVSLYKLIGF